MKRMSLKSLAVLCALSLQLSTIPAFAKMGGMDGGGGGAYQLESGKVVTLPEFGVLIEESNSPIVTTGKKYERYYTVPSEVSEEVYRIKKNLRKIIPGFDIPGIVLPATNGVFIDKKDVDMKEYERIKNEYKLVLAAFDYKLEEDKFILPAMTLNGKTYILPDFAKLSPTQQAKILIHETYMREIPVREDLRTGRLMRLEIALKRDTFVEKLLNAKSRDSLDYFDIMKTAYNLDFITFDNITTNVLNMMFEEIGHPIPAYEFMQILDRDTDLQLDPSLIQTLQEKYKLKRNYAEIFEGSIVRLSRVFLPGIDVEKFCKKNKRELGNWIFTNFSYIPNVFRMAGTQNPEEWRESTSVYMRCYKEKYSKYAFDADAYGITVQQTGLFFDQFKTKQ